MKTPRRKRRAETIETEAPPRVALDTGVLLHALLLSDDKAKQLRRAWLDGACVPLVDARSAQALMRALAYPVLQLEAAQQHELLADFLPYAEVVGTVVSARGTVSPAVQLAASDQARADCLVSDCEAARARFAKQFSRNERSHCRLLSSAEFLAGLAA